MVFVFGWCEVCRYGPEPTALPLVASSQAPGFENTCFGMILARVSRAAPSGNGNLRTSSTESSPVFLTSLSQLSKKPLASDCVPGSRIRSKTNTTSSAVTGFPSCHLAPSRRVNFQEVVASSASVGTFVASAAYGSRVIGSVSRRPS